MDRRIVAESTHTILVCHSNKSLVRIAQLNAIRHGITVIVARDGKDLLVKARGNVRPDAIILSDDLKEPATSDLVKALNADPRLKGIHVIVLKGLLGNIGELLKAFKRPPWIMNR
jgi:CheY-like chemotaxis protein